MGFGNKAPKHKGYEEQKDTPWITRNRELNTFAYDELPSMYENINVFDDATRAGLDARNDAIYNRAQSDFEKMYNDTMGKTLARDYNRFGTTGATPSLYARDLYNLQQQRELADLAYNKAMNYENMINQELDRRYNTLGAYSNLFNTTGGISQDFDDANWNIRNKNRDIDYANAVVDHQQKGSVIRDIGTAVGAVAGSVIPGIGTALGATLGNALGGAVGGGTSGSIQLPGLDSKQAGSTSGGLDWGQVLNFAKGLFGGGSNISNNISGIGSTNNTSAGSSVGGLDWGQMLNFAGNLFGNGGSTSSSGVNSFIGSSDSAWSDLFGDGVDVLFSTFGNSSSGGGSGFSFPWSK